MTPAELARIHARAMTTARPWSAADFESLLGQTGVFLIAETAGFALGRAVAGEAELLTLAVLPDARRQGAGRRLLAGFEDRARRDADTAFLEVAEDNAPALALYRAAGWEETGRRPRYYARPDGAVAACLFRKVFSPR